MESYYFKKARLKKKWQTIIDIFQKKEKRKKGQYTRNRCKNITDEKKQKRIEYLQDHYKTSRNSKLNDWLLALD